MIDARPVKGIVRRAGAPETLAPVQEGPVRPHRRRRPKSAAVVPVVAVAIAEAGAGYDARQRRRQPHALGNDALLLSLLALSPLQH